MKWTYGPDGEMFPVEHGQTWICGAHSFHCGSMFELVDVEGPTLIYADPPWNAALLHGYYTKAELVKPSFGWLDVYGQVLKLAGDRPCFLEGGQTQASRIRDIVTQPIYTWWPITYAKGKRPGVLHYAGQRMPLCNPSDLDDEIVPLVVMQTFEPGIVFDPCAGRGLTSRLAEQAGWQSVNNELNPNRMSAALAELQRMTGIEPTRGA